MLLCPIASGGIVPLTTISQVARAESSTNQITVPTVQDGDLGVLIEYSLWNASIADTIPSGWNQVVTDVAKTQVGPDIWVRGSVSRRIMLASDSNDVLTGIDGSADHKLLLIFRGNVPIKSVSQSTWEAQATGLNPTAQTPNPTGQLIPIIVFGISGANASTAAFSVQSPAFQDTDVVSFDSDLLVGWYIYNQGSTPGSHDVDMAQLSPDGNFFGSGWLKLS